LIGHKRELPTQTRRLIVQQLSCLSKEPDRHFPFRWTVARLWKSAKTTMQKGIVVDVNNSKKGRVGRKPRVFDINLLNVVPIHKRTIIKAMTSALGVGHSQVYRMMRSGNIRAHTNSIKPKLSHDHKLRRLNFILSQIIQPTRNTSPKFSLV
jgi:hypothetical protein